MARDSLDASDLAAFVAGFAALVRENRELLVELDAAIGDADHGYNLDRGLQAALESLPQSPETPRQVVKALATSLISKVGGAAGPLYGTALLRAATSMGDKATLDPSDVVAALEAGLGGLVARGKAEVGDKTMVDAWDPAVRAAAASVDNGGGMRAVLRAATQAAEEGVAATIPLVARKGRASYLGERSAGHQDPGATSSHLMFMALEACAGSADDGHGDDRHGASVSE